MNALAALIDAVWAERVGWALVHSVWQIAVVAIVFAAVAFLLRSRGPQTRYLAGCLFVRSGAGW